MVEFRVLGPLEILSDGRTVELAGSRTRAVLAVLLLHANRPVSMDRLIDDLWGASPPPRARGMVHNAVSAIRRAIDGGDDAPRLVRSPAGYQLRVAVDELDLSRFERLVAAAEERLSAGDSDGARARAEEAIGLWRGEALAEFAFEPFASPAVGRLEELRALAEELRVSALAESGGAAEAVADLRSLVAARPWSERLRYLLALALYRCGRQADALAELRSWRQSLDDQLGIEPAPEIRVLEQRILQHDSALGSDATTAGSPGSRRSVLLSVQAAADVATALPLCTVLAGEDHELVVVQPVPIHADLGGAAGQLSGAVASVPCERPVRSSAFRSGEVGEDLRRLARDLEAALVVQIIDGAAVPHDALDRVECDVALLRPGRRSEGRAVVAAFGGTDHDWLAIELAAVAAARMGVPMKLFGGARSGADASRVLAVASVAVQRFLGVAVEPVVGGAETLLEEAASGAMMVLGLSGRWRSEGLGSVRAHVLEQGAGPVMLARRGLGPSALAPPAALTRFTWSLDGA